MEAVKKYWIWGIFISILSVFAMSYNANAITGVFDLSQYSIVRSTQTLSLDCVFPNAEIIATGSSVCEGRILGNAGIRSVYSTTTYSVKKNDILNFYLLIWSEFNNYEYLPRLSGIPNQSEGWNLIDIHEVSNDILGGTDLGSDGYINWSPNNDFDINFTNLNGFIKIYDVSLRAMNDGNLKYGLSTSSQFISFNSNDANKRFFVTLRNFNLYRFEGSEENKEVQEKTQEAADASETAGGSSSTDAQTGTTSLINAITGAVTVISSASPTNCRINGNMGNLDMGQLDLCANPAPAFVTTIGSLILILMCVPLAITLFNRFISLFRSFQS